MLEHYFKYRLVIARFRRGALGNELDHIAADLSRAGYKRDSLRLYLARIARFSEYAVGCGCNKSRPIPREIVERYLRARPTIGAHRAAQVAIGHAARCFRIDLWRRSLGTSPIRMARCLRPICNTCELFAAYSRERVRGSF